MTGTRDRHRTAGLVVFTVLCLLGSWSVAATLRILDPDLSQRRLGTQLLTVSLQYIVTMGWQPVVATWFVRRWVERDGDDLALNPCRARFTFVGAATALAFAVVAAALAFVAAKLGWMAPSSVNGSAESKHGTAAPSWISGAGVIIGGLVALALVWVQSVAEEIGWRGYLLPTAMRRFGRWRGLVLQGAVWGLWYAPVVFFSTYGRIAGVEALARCVSFAISCVLFGILLGWLRLASGSVIPAVTANLTLTLIAGMPYAVHGIDAGLRSAIFRPVGSLVLLAALAALFASRWRSAIQLPADAAPQRQTIGWGHLLLLVDGRRDRTLH